MQVLIVHTNLLTSLLPKSCSLLSLATIKVPGPCSQGAHLGRRRSVEIESEARTRRGVCVCVCVCVYARARACVCVLKSVHSGDPIREAGLGVENVGAQGRVPGASAEGRARQPLRSPGDPRPAGAAQTMNSWRRLPARLASVEEAGSVGARA